MDLTDAALGFAPWPAALRSEPAIEAALRPLGLSHTY
jgi:hypothetical protein